jgi:hypothetical protein
MTHPSREELLSLTQRGADPALVSRVNAHIAVCGRCAATRRAMGRVEEALTSLRPESPSPGFQRSVLKKLGLTEAGSIWWTFMKNFSPVLVAGIVVGSIVAFGSGTTGGGWRIPENSPVDGEKILTFGAGVLSGWTSAVGGFFRAVLPSLMEEKSMGLTLTLILIFAGIGLVDRYIVGPLFRRRHQGLRT